MNQYRIFLIMERVWLVLAILAFLFGAWFASQGKWDLSKMPFFCTFCAAILFGLRRYQRKKMEKSGKA